MARFGMNFPGFTEADYSTLGERALAEPTEEEACVEAGLRWFVETKADQPWTANDYRTASIVLTVAANETRLRQSPTEEL